MSPPLRTILIVAVIAVFAFGAWHWYTDRSQSDLDQLATEVKNRPASEGARLGEGVNYRMMVLGAKFLVAVAVFVIGYSRWKSSISP
jgi:hypothetical protein